jgi:hypothetical protein
MCSAIVGMTRNKKATVEYRFNWSPKIEVAEELDVNKPIRLRKEGYENLEYAAIKLKTVKPEKIKLIGHVRALTSSDNPLSLGTRRSIVIKSIYPGTNRVIDVIVELDREDYAKATDAHIEWHTVQVNGVLSRTGTIWRLIDSTCFRIFGDSK